MKYQKTFFALCAVVFLFTLFLLAVLIFDIAGTITLTVGKLICVAGGLLIMILPCLICICILQSLYEDWKWRHLKKNEKWRR